MSSLKRRLPPQREGSYFNTYFMSTDRVHFERKGNFFAKYGLFRQDLGSGNPNLQEQEWNFQSQEQIFCPYFECRSGQKPQKFKGNFSNLREVIFKIFSNQGGEFKANFRILGM